MFPSVPGECLNLNVGLNVYISGNGTTIFGGGSPGIFATFTNASAMLTIDDVIFDVGGVRAHDSGHLRITNCWFKSHDLNSQEDSIVDRNTPLSGIYASRTDVRYFILFYFLLFARLFVWLFL